MGVFGMASLFRNSFVLLAALFCCLQVGASTRTVVVQPGQIEPTYTSGQGPYKFAESRNWNATVSTQAGSRISVPVSATRAYTAGSVALALKNALKLHPGRLASAAAMTAALAAIEIVLDPDPAPGSDPGLVTPQYEIVPMSNLDPLIHPHWEMASGRGVTPAQACANAPQNPEYYCGECTITSPTQAECVIRTVSNGGYADIQRGRMINSNSPCPAGSKLVNSACRTPGGYAPAMPSSLDGFADVYLPNMTPSDFGVLMGTPSAPNPDATIFAGPPSIDGTPTTTTSTNPTTGDTTVTTSQPSYNFDYSTNPLTITTTTTTTNNTYNNGVLTNTTTTTNQSPNPEPATPEQLIPTDCEFMPTVCDFIDWVKEPFDEDEPDLTQLLDDEDYQKEITFNSNATCPGPTPISTSFDTYYFDWSPGCEWAGMIKPFVIIAALIAAIYINLGISRGSE